MRNDLPLARRRSSVLLALALAAGTALPTLAAVPARADGPPVIVTSLTGSASAAAAAVRAAGGRVLDTLSLAGGVSAQLPAGTVLAPSYRIVADVPIDVAQGPDRGQAKAQSVRKSLGRGKPAGEGKGVTVAVVDTGVADVPDLAGRVEHVKVAGSKPGDGFGHGTFVAGLIAGSGAGSPEYAGIAPEARILDVKVADNSGSTSLIKVLKGLQVVAAHPEVSVVNLSLSSGSELPYQIDPLTVALETLWRRGVTVVVPAGNDGDDPGSITSPGVDPVLLTVGALDGTSVADWSSRGPAPQGVAKPDLVAAGTHVISLRAPGSAIDTEHPSARVGDSYFKASGTSFSTATTAGAAAALLAVRPGLTPSQVKAVLMASATPAGNATAAGAGALDLTAALTSPAPTAPALPPGDAALWQSLGAAIAAGDAQAAASSWSQLSPEAKAWAASSWSALSPEAQAWLSMNWASMNWAAQFASMNWASMTPAAIAWASMNWASMNWAASSWSSMNWASQNWASMNWAASSWSAHLWASMNWASMNWAASSWSSQNWASMNWASQNWASQNWASQNWASQNWASQNWASQNWASQNWASQNWASQNWASQNWASQNWASQNWASQNWASQNWG